MDKLKRLSRDDLAKLSDKDLQNYAKQHKITLAEGQSRDDAIAAIELHHEEADKAAAAAKSPVRGGASGKSAKPADGAELTGEQIEAVQRVWADFSRNIPQPAMSSGTHQLTQDERKAAFDYGVPDGDYRVVGADWILTFERGRFVEASRGGPTTKADSYASVPATEHRVPG